MRLLNLNLNPIETNDDGESVMDVCPGRWTSVLEDHGNEKRRKDFRGMSLVAEAAQIKNIRTAAKSVIAAAKSVSPLPAQLHRRPPSGNASSIRER